MSEFTYNKDNFPVEALIAIRKVLETGKRQGYKTGEWRNEPALHHLGKAIHHFGRALSLGINPGGAKDGDMTAYNHLAHGLCRAAMAVAVTVEKNKIRNGGHTVETEEGYDNGCGSRRG